MVQTIPISEKTTLKYLRDRLRHRGFYHQLGSCTSSETGFLAKIMLETLDIWFRNPVSLPLLRMMQDVS